MKGKMVLEKTTKFPSKSPVLRKGSTALCIEGEIDDDRSFFLIKRSIKQGASTSKKLAASLGLFAILMVIIWPMIVSNITKAADSSSFILLSQKSIEFP